MYCCSQVILGYLHWTSFSLTVSFFVHWGAQTWYSTLDVIPKFLNRERIGTSLDLLSTLSLVQPSTPLILLPGYGILLTHVQLLCKHKLQQEFVAMQCRAAASALCSLTTTVYFSVSFSWSRWDTRWAPLASPLVVGQGGTNCVQE